jgi:hypothetical protein
VASFDAFVVHSVAASCVAFVGRCSVTPLKNPAEQRARVFAFDEFHLICRCD